MKIAPTPWMNDTSLRKAAHAILEAGLSAIDTKESIARRVHLEGKDIVIDDIRFPLPEGKLYVVGAGKCSGDALTILADILGEHITIGYVIDIVARRPAGRCEVVIGDHPYPTDRNVLHTDRLLSFLAGLTEKDAIIFIISGGGTVLLAQPPLGFSADEEATLVKTLFKGGATIQEMNTVRKHLSTARGGFLAAAIAPARSLSLIFSDVPGNDLGFISSGPTVLDRTTVDDARSVILKFGKGVPEASRAIELLLETPKDEDLFKNAKHVLFMSNQVALDAMAKKAKELDFSPHIVTDKFSDSAEGLGRKIAGEITTSSPRTCLLYGGETTVEITGHGKGGRNRHLALAALSVIDAKCILLAAASDGIDNGPRSGAIADSGVLSAAREKGMDPLQFLKNNDSHEFFEKVGGYVNTGPTGSNVADLVIALHE